MLCASWVAFAVAIVSTLISFMTSQRAIDQHPEFADQYYRRADVEALSRSSPFRMVTSWMNALAGLAFITGVGLTIAFAITNFS